MQALRSWGLHCLDQNATGTELERRKLWFHPCWVFLRLEKVSGGPTKGEAASQPNFLALDFFPIAISLQVPRGGGHGGAHLVQTLAAQVAHGLLNALWQWLSCALHMDERRHPKHVLAPVIWGFVPFHELGH